MQTKKPDGTSGSSEANKRQIGGDHYSRYGGYQHWDVVHRFDLDYFQGQITKYVMRWKLKGGLADLHKARHFLDKYIELHADDEGAEPGPSYINQD